MESVSLLYQVISLKGSIIYSIITVFCKYSLQYLGKQHCIWIIYLDIFFLNNNRKIDIDRKLLDNLNHRWMKIKFKIKSMIYSFASLWWAGNCEHSEWETGWVFWHTGKWEKSPWLVHLLFNRGIKFLSLYSLSAKKPRGREGGIEGEKTSSKKTNKEKRKERQTERKRHMISSHVMQVNTLLANEK